MWKSNRGKGIKVGLREEKELGPRIKNGKKEWFGVGRPGGQGLIREVREERNEEEREGLRAEWLRYGYWERERTVVGGGWGSEILELR